MKLTLTIISFLFAFWANAQELDIVGYDEISINEITAKSSESALLKVFGKPKSIIEPNYECGALSPTWNDVDVKLYSWDGIEFHCVDGVLEVGRIDFSKANPRIKTKQLTLDKNTKLTELKKAYPNSYKVWEGQKDKGGTSTFYLSTEENSDSQFHIVIENGKVIGFELFHPC
ncbi:hypothetical protein [uncultured Pontibacter sp.]|uniref:hypothetical protein n=1 Tax=uncultured Pontibacter sp. TaxID=453356 RepID=UPI00262BAEB1|nr:hypothetical protein [uncultured Pontibacter sp.]